MGLAAPAASTALASPPEPAGRVSPPGSRAAERYSCGSCCAPRSGAGVGSPPPRGRHGPLAEARVEHLARAASRAAGLMCWVQLRCTVTSPVRVGRSTACEVESRLDAGRRPDQCPVGAGHDAQLARLRVGTGHRDADGERAALVGVATQAAVLVPGNVRDALHDADRLGRARRPAVPGLRCHVAYGRESCRCAGSGRHRARAPATLRSSGRSPPFGPDARLPSWVVANQALRVALRVVRARPPRSRPRRAAISCFAEEALDVQVARVFEEGCACPRRSPAA